MSTIDTSTWNPDPALNESIGDIPLNANASIQQTWQAIQMLMAAGGLHGLQLVTFDGATASADGASGLVPAPEAGDQDKVLKGDGTWGAVAAANHVHGNITNDGKVGTTSGLPLVTGTGGAVQAGSFGSSAGTFCEGNDSRLSNARTPTSHTHGSITNDGKLGTASRVVVTDGSNVIGVSSITTTKLGYLTDVTANIQGQIDGKANDSSVVHQTGNETISGSKTFNALTITASGNLIGTANTKAFFVCGGTGNSGAEGAYMVLLGSTNTNGNAGCFFLRAATSTSIVKTLNGRPDGTLTWTGQNIQTSSDERLKTPMSAVPDDILDAWEDVRWGQFKYLDAIDCKGNDARLHLGLIAQRVKAVFEARGLDALAYGILCHEKRPASEEEPAIDLWMVRYEEALAMEAACQRRRADMLEARIAALEEKLK